jgi:hypothetical protein
MRWRKQRNATQGQVQARQRIRTVSRVGGEKESEHAPAEVRMYDSATYVAFSHEFADEVFLLSRVLLENL